MNTNTLVSMSQDCWSPANLGLKSRYMLRYNSDIVDSVLRSRFNRWSVVLSGHCSASTALNMHTVHLTVPIFSSKTTPSGLMYWTWHELCSVGEARFRTGTGDLVDSCLLCRDHTTPTWSCCLLCIVATTAMVRECPLKGSSYARHRHTCQYACRW